MEKSISQIATTIEQSKRLLAAGIDPASADMCYANVEFNPNYRPDIRLSVIPYAKCVETYKTVGLIAEGIVPAWSLSRLWDIMRGFLIIPRPQSSAELITSLVAEISDRANDGTLSKELLK